MIALLNIVAMVIGWIFLLVGAWMVICVSTWLAIEYARDVIRHRRLWP